MSNEKLSELYDETGEPRWGFEGSLLQPDAPTFALQMPFAPWMRAHGLKWDENGYPVEIEPGEEVDYSL